MALQIPGYVIHREIGAGGMAKVFLATQTSLDRQVALKVMSPALAADPTFAKRFQREARTIAGLTHPHIVAVYEVGMIQHMHFFAMQHLAGGDLAGRLRKGIAEPELVRVLCAVAKALGFAHSRGVVHRDVTPGNILFDSADNPVLTDFGIARSQQGSTRITHTGVSIGTSSYMSPEQARGGEVDARSDLYSLGALLFEALTGKPPYSGQDGFAVAYAHVFEPIPRLPAEVQHWQALIDRVMAKSADDRYANSEELIAAMQAIPTHPQRVLPLTAQPLEPGLRAPPPRTRAAAAAPAPAPAVPAPVPTAAPTQRMHLPARIPEVVAVSRTAEVPQVTGRARGPLYLAAAGGVLLVLGVVGYVAGWFGGGEPAPVAPVVRIDPPVAVPADPTPTVPQPAPEVAQDPQAPAQDPALNPAQVPDAEGALDLGMPSAPDLLADPADPTDSADLDQPGAFVGPPSRSEFVQPIIAQGRVLLTRGALLEPARANAFEVFRYALAVDPSANAARTGLRDVALELEKQALAAHERNVLPEARQRLEQAQTVARAGNDKDPLLETLPAHLQGWVQTRMQAAAQAETRWATADAARLYAEVLLLQPEFPAALEGQKRAAAIGRPGYRFADTLKVGGTGPQMVVIAPGNVTLTDDRSGRLDVRVEIGFAMALQETTVAEFRRYVEASGRAPASSGCNDREGVRLFESKERTWLAPGYAQTDQHPVTCLLVADVEGYVRWLGEQTGRRYRLPSEPQWRLAAGTLGAADCRRANLGDRRYGTELRGRKPLGCDDGHAATAPVGSFPAGMNGLFDMAGNVREWTADCFSRTVTARPANGSAWAPAGCGERLVLGTAWISGSDEPAVTPRLAFRAKDLDNTVGFRVIMELP